MNQQDITGWKGMAQQSLDYNEKYGRFPLWTNALFSGMPAYTIAMEATVPIFTSYLHGAMTLWLPKPMNFFFLASICFYFLCCVLRIHPALGITGALAYAYCSYSAVIVAVGHDTKMQAIGLAPAVIGSVLLLLQRKYLWGLGLLSVVFSYQIGTQHLQVVYYTFIVIGLLVVTYLITQRKKESIKNLLLPLPLILLGTVIGYLTFAVSLFPLQEYAKETIRGGRSELTPVGTDAANKTKGGLDKDYAFNYSYGIGETLTLTVPGIYGGSQGGREHKSATAFSEKMTEAGVPEDQALQMANGYSYWGNQPGTSGPVYVGAVLCFLFLFGLVYLDSWHKWWLLVATIVGIVLAWGKNFSALNYFLFDYLPFYNKFRAPTIALVIPQLTFPLMGALAVNQLLTDKRSKAEIGKKFKTSLYVAGGLILLLVLMYFSLSYKSANDQKIADSFTQAMMAQGGNNPQVRQQAAEFGRSAVRSLQEDRKALYGGDLLRSILFMAAAAGIVWALVRNKIKPMYGMGALALLVLLDLLPVDKRYLNSDSFVEKEEFDATFTPTEADKVILADAAKPFRVFDQTEDPFNNTTAASRTSYFHHSVGGYHPAKLALYQDIIERQLSKGNMNVFNMLNTKYFIISNPANRQPQAQINPDAFGPVWLVKAIRFVNTADAEMAALDGTNLRDTAIVQQKFRDKINALPVADSSARIAVKAYSNDKITYAYTSASPQFAVFSDVYYALGWDAYIDGAKADYVKTNYVLRGMALPAGQHTIEFRFEPTSFTLGNTVTLITSLLAVLLLAAAVFFEWRQTKKSETPPHPQPKTPPVKKG